MPLLDIPARLRRLGSDLMLRAKASSTSSGSGGSFGCAEEQLHQEHRRKSNDALDAPAMAVVVPFESPATATQDASTRDPLRRRMPRRLPSMTALLLCFPKVDDDDDDSPPSSSTSPASSTDTKQPQPNGGQHNLSFSPSFLWAKMPKHGMTTTTTTTTPTPTEGSPVMRARPLSLTLNRHSLELGDFVSSCGSGVGERLHTSSLPPTPALKLRTEEVLLTSEVDGPPVWAKKTVLEGYAEARDRAIIFLHGLTATSDLCWSTLTEDTSFHHSLLVPDVKSPGGWLARPLIHYDLRHHGQSVAVAETLSGLSAAAVSQPVSSKALVSDFKAVCARFGVRSTLLVGWSIGATVTADLVAAAATDPAAAGLPTINGLIWVAPFPWVSLASSVIDDEVFKVTTPLFEQGAKYMAAAMLPVETRMALQGDNVDPSIAVAKLAFVAQALHPESSNASTSATADACAIQLSSSALSLPAVAFFQYCTRPDNDPSALIEAVRTGKVKLLHLHGEKDASIKCEETVRALKEAFGAEEEGTKSAYEVVRFEGAGHGLPVFKARECKEKIIEWIGRVEDRSQQETSAAAATNATTAVAGDRTPAPRA